MLKIFEVYFDSFKYSYSGHWTSIEKALIELPQNPRFLRMMEFNKPYLSDPDAAVSCEPDWEFNKTLPFVLTYNSEKNQIEVSRPGYRFKRTKKVTLPEIKEVGEIYSPSKTYNDELEPVVFNQVFKVGDVYEIELDSMKDNY